MKGEINNGLLVKSKKIHETAATTRRPGLLKVKYKKG
jgi:hypothetical protein